MRPLLLRILSVVFLITTLSWASALVAQIPERLPAEPSNTPPPPCADAEGCFRDAMALEGISSASGSTRGARTAGKLERLRLVRERFPSSLWAKRATLLSALMLIDSEPAEAMRFLRAAQRDFPALEDYIKLWTADALLKAGDTAAAASAFDAVAELSDTPLAATASFRSGLVWEKAGNCRRAAESLQRALGLAPQHAAAPSGWLRLGQCLARDGREADGRAAFEQLWTRFPHTAEARDAAARLSKNSGVPWRPSPDALYERATAFLALAFHQDAIDEFRRFLSAAPQHPRRDDARLKLGTALVRLKRYDEARDVFQSLAGGSASYAAEALVWLGKIALRQGDGGPLVALASHSKLSGEQRATIRLMIGTWQEDQGRAADALASYRLALAGTANSGQAPEAIWRIGWLQYRQDRFAEAIEAFQDLARRDDAQWTPQGLYWLARAQERGRQSQAGDGYAELCRRYPFTYYCLLVQVGGRLADNVVVPSPDREPPTDVLVVARQDRRVWRALELKALGLEEDAARELLPLLDRVPRERHELIQLSTVLNEAGAYHQALRLVRLYFRESLERGGDPLPSAVWRAGYPTAYVPVIRVYAGPRLDPFLAAAIIREESQYDARALSRVGAIGLMQLMPATAQAVARRLGTADIGRDDLFDGETNIRFGVRYLDQLLTQFADNVVYAVAAYNAGPVAVSSWIEKFGSADADEFVELIPYQETRQYVKRVVRSYREYRRLAGISCGAGSLDKVC